MKILCFGSLNIDYVYQVANFAKEGQTIPSTSFNTNAGGKGLNQAIALSRVSNDVYFAGKVGNDGKQLVNVLYDNNVNTEYIGISKEITGHAIIQVNNKGNNCIITHGGANFDIDKMYINQVLSNFKQGDLLIIQNEVSNVPYIINEAHKIGIKIIYNPSPISAETNDIDFAKLEYLVINHHEGKVITEQKALKDILDTLHSSYPSLKVILTAGSKGAYYKDNKESIFVKSHKVKAIDTTCAGDTFLGFFLGGIINGKSTKESMKIASKAASITVTKEGASVSIPTINEI